MRAVLITALAALLFSPLAAQADLVHNGDSVQVLNNNTRRTGSGGAFIIDNQTQPNGSHPDNFYTFCLELSESISLGGTYTATLSTKAINGSVGPAGDPLSKGTVYLWNAYNTLNPGSGIVVGNTTTTQLAALLKQDLFAFDGSSFNEASVNDNQSLQRAIWTLENESGSGEPAADALATKLIALAQSKTGNDAYGDSLPVLGVMNLNTYNASGEIILHQSMLYPILSPGSSVPEAGQIVGLSLVSLIAGLCVYSKKRFAASREEGEQNS